MNIPKSFRVDKLFARKLYAIWFRYARFFAIALFLVTIVGGALVWYDSVYRMAWTEEEKRAYAAQEFKETAFREDAFREALARTVARQEVHARDIDPGRDIFEDAGSTDVSPVAPEPAVSPAIVTPVAPASGIDSGVVAR